MSAPLDPALRNTGPHALGSGEEQARPPHRFRKWRLLLPALYTLFLLFSPGGLHAETWVHVRWVADGDTVFLSDNRRLRYIGIDSPETAHEGRPAEPYADQAKRMNRKLVFRKQIRLEFDRERNDRYGRLLAYVFLADGTFVNREMIARGLAHVLPHPPNGRYDGKLLKAQRAAMKAGKGLWQNWAEEEGSYIGNRHSRRFHRADCPFGKKIARRNRTRFVRKWDALWAGFAPAKGCLPSLNK